MTTARVWTSRRRSLAESKLAFVLTAVSCCQLNHGGCAVLQNSNTNTLSAVTRTRRRDPEHSVFCLTSGA